MLLFTKHNVHSHPLIRIMDKKSLTELLQQVQEGHCSIDQALNSLRNFPSETLPNGCIDHQRTLRTGIPEVIFGAGKSAEQIIELGSSMLKHSGPVLVTRVSRDKAEVVLEALPQFDYSEQAKMLSSQPQQTATEDRKGTVLVACAGTSDLPVAEEAALTAACFGNPVERLYDAGVAGLHRLLHKQELLYKASVIVVVAGMEGALPSVVAGLVSCPVIGVPTSIGYGASFGGVAALLGMLNSCAPGLAVVNIDNGFGAACMADAINRSN